MEKYGGETKHGGSGAGTAALCLFRLLLLRSTDRTCICAGAAFETCVCINLILAVALCDCTDRTCICTCTALNASITDRVCHDLLPPVKIDVVVMCAGERSTTLQSLLYHIFRKNQEVFKNIFAFLIFRQICTFFISQTHPRFTDMPDSGQQAGIFCAQILYKGRLLWYDKG